MENELITVAVPVYNMGQYLARSLDSLLVQTYKRFEILLVDDGSTDDSGALCDEYEKKYDCIRTVHKQNGGLSSARNAGIDNARGDFIIFPDPDDWVKDSYLEVLVSLHRKYNADLEVCGHYVTDGDREIPHNPQGTKRLLERDDALCVSMASTGFCGFAWNKLYHMDIIREHSLYFDTELGMAQDLHFAFRYLLLCQKIAYDPAPQYYYYQHIGGVTNTKAPLSARKISGLKTYEKIAELAHGAYPETENAAYSTLANMTIHFMYIYFDSKTNDQKLLLMLRDNLKQYGQFFFDNPIYSARHKLLGRLAAVSPKLYYITKKCFHN